jgi:hypothetical protein
VHPKKKGESHDCLHMDSQTQSAAIAHDEQLFVIPFAKSAVAALHTPVRSSTVWHRLTIPDNVGFLFTG